MKTHPNMSDDEWEAFLAAIPEEKKVPIEDYDAFLRKEMATEGDFRWWNSMSGAEQEGLKKILQTQNLGLLMYLHKDMGMSATDALIKMHKTNAIYDEYPLSEQHIAELERNGFHEEDYPLLWELADRVGRYMKSLRPDSDSYRAAQTLLQESTSANAAIRHLLRTGMM